MPSLAHSTQFQHRNHHSTRRHYMKTSIPFRLHILTNFTTQTLLQPRFQLVPSRLSSTAQKSGNSNTIPKHKHKHHHHKMYNRRHPQVPTISSVIPGASVNIVLKADQPTGKLSHGVVRDILTRGNHPRGIKVRLADGRVGRVQSMGTAPSNSIPSGSGSGSGSGGVDGLVEGIQGASLDNDGDEVAAGSQQQDQDAFWNEGGFRSGRGGRRGGRRGRGGRKGGERFQSGFQSGRDEDGEGELPSQKIGLDAYVKEAKPRRRGRGNQAAASLEDEEERHQDPPAPRETVTCPVCGAFEGDEAAVSHHVASHFEESVS